MPRNVDVPATADAQVKRDFGAGVDRLDEALAFTKKTIKSLVSGKGCQTLALGAATLSALSASLLRAMEIMREIVARCGCGLTSDFPHSPPKSADLAAELRRLADELGPLVACGHSLATQKEELTAVRIALYYVEVGALRRRLGLLREKFFDNGSGS
jgi:hypothetical protein